MSSQLHVSKRHPVLIRLLISFLVLFIFNIENTNAQSSASDTTFGYHYRMIVETPIYLCDIRGVQASDSLYEAPARAIFTHIGNKGDSIIIRFWDWKEKYPDAISAYNYRNNDRNQQCYFLMSASDFMQKAIRRYPRKPSFAVGAATVPFKIRTGPFAFTNDVNIGPVVGAKFRLSRYTNSNFFNVLIGFGISSVNLDSTSTGGNIMPGALVTNPAALTISLGGVFEFSNVQVGAFIGKDYINNNSKIEWTYQGKTWFSIGLGYTLFSKSTASQPGNALQNKTAIGGN